LLPMEQLPALAVCYAIHELIPEGGCNVQKGPGQDVLFDVMCNESYLIFEVRLRR
jgi:hypothetical protein